MIIAPREPMTSKSSCKPDDGVGAEPLGPVAQFPQHVLARVLQLLLVGRRAAADEVGHRRHDVAEDIGAGDDLAMHQPEIVGDLEALQFFGRADQHGALRSGDAYGAAAGASQAGVAGGGGGGYNRLPSRIRSLRPVPNMLLDDRLYMGTSTKPEYLLLKYGNRHGLVTGATGTGKTVTLQGLAEGFSRAGVPVFCADVKGDSSGLAQMGEAKDWIVKRAQEIGFDDFKSDKFPVIFWDLFGKQGHPVRTTISEMGPLLLRASSISTTRRRACSTSPSSSPTTTACCCSTSRICARC